MALLAAALVWILTGACDLHASTTEPVKFETKDGFTLHADLTPAEDPGAPVAILLHMYRSNRAAWEPLTPRLANAGFTVLAIDQRAHGGSIQKGERVVRVAEVPRSEFASLVRQGPADVRAARAFLKERDLATDQIVLFGASYGCTVSLLSAGDVQGVKALVLLSPGTSYFGVDVTGAARDFKGLILAVAAEDDPQAVESANAIVGVHAGTDRIVIYRSGGHGTRLFPTRPGVLDLVVEFASEAVVR